MPPRLRKFVLTAHITSSVGWLGAVVCSLVLGVAAVTSPDAHIVRASYLAMALLGWFVLVPLSLASLITGLIQSLGTSWGLFRHYWVLIKLVMNVFASAVLLLYTRTFRHLATLAADPGLADASLLSQRDPSPVVHGAAALLLLAVAATLSVYKPRGLTRHGQRTQRLAPLPSTRPAW